ncbi:MAG: RNA methyltransferase [Acidobacteriia bacterium]|nr:RNA methyltransferase [Terriglobia bacterium]
MNRRPRPGSPPRTGPREIAARGRTNESEPGEVLYGVHPVLEALEAGRRTIDRILVARDSTQGLGRALRKAREEGVPVAHLPREVIARKVGRRAVHQGIVALVSAVAYADPDEICRDATGRADGLILVLDGIEDPRNLGAAVRSAAGAGASGILLGLEGTVGLTAAAAKSSAGAAERIPVAREPRLPERLLALRTAGFRVLGLDARGERAWDALDLSGRNVIVAGGEGRGLRKRLADACDHRVFVPLERGVESLNVSVAVAVVLFEAVRQRRRMKRDGTSE